MFSNMFWQFELIFCIQDEKDPACKVVEPLMEKYPHVDARLFVGKYLCISSTGTKI